MVSLVLLTRNRLVYATGVVYCDQMRRCIRDMPVIRSTEAGHRSEGLPFQDFSYTCHLINSYLECKVTTPSWVSMLDRLKN